jgi:hypothetical protein
MICFCEFGVVVSQSIGCPPCLFSLSLRYRSDADKEIRKFFHKTNKICEDICKFFFKKKIVKQIFYFTKYAIANPASKLHEFVMVEAPLCIIHLSAVQ